MSYPADPENPPEYPGNPPPGGGCPPGQIPKANGQGCKPAGQWWDESPDELSRQGLETCDESQHPEPRDCYWCDFDTRTWKRGWCGPGAGGGGSSGGGGGGRTTSTWQEPVFSVPSNTIEKTIWDQIQRTLSGQDLPYSDEVVTANKAALFSGVHGQTHQAQQSIDEQMVSSGMLRSGARIKAREDLARTGQQAYSQGINKINADKVMANYQARMDALGRAKQLLDGQRDYLLRREGNDIARTQGLAQIQLGYAQIANQMAMLQAQLGSNWQIAQLNAGQVNQQQLLDLIRTIFGTTGRG